MMDIELDFWPEVIIGASAMKRRWSSSNSAWRSAVPGVCIRRRTRSSASALSHTLLRSFCLEPVNRSNCIVGSSWGV